MIAGSATVFYLISVGKLSLGRYFTTFFFPTLIGNIVGGVSWVAALAHGQVVGGKRPPGRRTAQREGKQEVYRSEEGIAQIGVDYAKPADSGQFTAGDEYDDL